MDSDQISATEAYALKYLMSWYRTTTVDIRTLCEVLHIDNIESMPRSVYPYFYSFLLTQHAADTFFTQIEPELRLAHARIGALQDKIFKVSCILGSLLAICGVLAFLSFDKLQVLTRWVVAA